MARSRARAPATRPRRSGPAPPALPDAPAGRSPAASHLLLAALVLARGALAFAPGMWAWGLNLLRFVPGPAWATWALSALALIPSAGRAAARLLDRLGEALDSPRWMAYGFWAVAAATLVGLFPDRTWFVGDFLLREITSHTGRSIFATLYPQGQPLDAFLHDGLVRWLGPALGLDALGVGRLIGAAGAAALGALSLRFARALDGRGACALATASVVFFGGGLPLLAGYNKAFAELTLVAVAVGAFGIEGARRGRGLLALGIAFAFGLALHRLALGFLPAVAATWWLALRGPLAGGAWKRPTSLAAAAVPLAALALALPRVLGLVARFDVTGNFAPPEVQRQGGVLAAALSAVHLADWANVLLLLAPLAPLAALGPWNVGSPARRTEAVVLAALAVPMVGFTLFFHPPQGVFRDWDGFAASAMTLSLVAAWVASGVLRRPGAAWLAPAVLLGAAAPSLQWLVHNSDVERGLARVEAHLQGPPPRTDLATASAWDFLGMRAMDFGQTDRSAAAFARAAEIAPSPKILRAWAVAELTRGDLTTARRIYRRLTERAPDHPTAWGELATVSLRMGDSTAARGEARRALEVRPDDRQALRVLQLLEPATGPDAGTSKRTGSR